MLKKQSIFLMFLFSCTSLFSEVDTTFGNAGVKTITNNFVEPVTQNKQYQYNSQPFITGAIDNVGVGQTLLFGTLRDQYKKRFFLKTTVSGDLSSEFFHQGYTAVPANDLNPEKLYAIDTFDTFYNLDTGAEHRVDIMGEQALIRFTDEGVETLWSWGAGFSSDYERIVSHVHKGSTWYALSFYEETGSEKMQVYKSSDDGTSQSLIKSIDVSGNNWVPVALHVDNSNTIYVLYNDAGSYTVQVFSESTPSTTTATLSFSDAQNRSGFTFYSVLPNSSFVFAGTCDSDAGHQAFLWDGTASNAQVLTLPTGLSAPYTIDTCLMKQHGHSGEDAVFIAGTQGADTLWIAKYSTAGALDTNFGTNGLAQNQIADSSLVTFGDLIYNNDASYNLTIAATMTSTGEISHVVCARFDEDGGVDTNFGEYNEDQTAKLGYARFAIVDGSYEKQTFDSEGNTLLVGTTDNQDEVFLQRFDKQGVEDSTFGLLRWQSEDFEFTSPLMNLHRLRMQQIAHHNLGTAADNHVLLVGVDEQEKVGVMLAAQEQAGVAGTIENFENNKGKGRFEIMSHASVQDPSSKVQLFRLNAADANNTATDTIDEIVGVHPIVVGTTPGWALVFKATNDGQSKVFVMGVDTDGDLLDEFNEVDSIDGVALESGADFLHFGKNPAQENSYYLITTHPDPADEDNTIMKLREFYRDGSGTKLYRDLTFDLLAQVPSLAPQVSSNSPHIQAAEIDENGYIIVSGVTVSQTDVFIIRLLPQTTTLKLDNQNFGEEIDIQGLITESITAGSPVPIHSVEVKQVVIDTHGIYIVATAQGQNSGQPMVYSHVVVHLTIDGMRYTDFSGSGKCFAINPYITGTDSLAFFEDTALHTLYVSGLNPFDQQWMLSRYNRNATGFVKSFENNTGFEIQVTLDTDTITLSDGERGELLHTGTQGNVVDIQGQGDADHRLNDNFSITNNSNEHFVIQESDLGYQTFTKTFINKTNAQVTVTVNGNDTSIDPGASQDITYAGSGDTATFVFSVGEEKGGSVVISSDEDQTFELFYDPENDQLATDDTTAGGTGGTVQVTFTNNSDFDLDITVGGGTVSVSSLAVSNAVYVQPEETATLVGTFRQGSIIVPASVQENDTITVTNTNLTATASTATIHNLTNFTLDIAHADAGDLEIATTDHDSFQSSAGDSVTITAIGTGLSTTLTLDDTQDQTVYVYYDPNASNLALEHDIPPAEVSYLTFNNSTAEDVTVEASGFGFEVPAGQSVQAYVYDGETIQITTPDAVGTYTVDVGTLTSNTVEIDAQFLTDNTTPIASAIVVYNYTNAVLDIQKTGSAVTTQLQPGGDTAFDTTSDTITLTITAQNNTSLLVELLNVEDDVYYITYDDAGDQLFATSLNPPGDIKKVTIQNNATVQIEATVGGGSFTLASSANQSNIYLQQGEVIELSGPQRTGSVTVNSGIVDGDTVLIQDADLTVTPSTKTIHNLTNFDIQFTDPENAGMHVTVASGGSVPFSTDQQAQVEMVAQSSDASSVHVQFDNTKDQTFYIYYDAGGNQLQSAEETAPSNVVAVTVSNPTSLDLQVAIGGIDVTLNAGALQNNVFVMQGDQGQISGSKRSGTLTIPGNAQNNDVVEIQESGLTVLASTKIVHNYTNFSITLDSVDAGNQSLETTTSTSFNTDATTLHITTPTALTLDLSLDDTKDQDLYIYYDATASVSQLAYQEDTPPTDVVFITLENNADLELTVTVSGKAFDILAEGSDTMYAQQNEVIQAVGVNHVGSVTVPGSAQNNDTVEITDGDLVVSESTTTIINKTNKVIKVQHADVQGGIQLLDSRQQLSFDSTDDSELILVDVDNASGQTTLDLKDTQTQTFYVYYDEDQSNLHSTESEPTLLDVTFTNQMSYTVTVNLGTSGSVEIIPNASQDLLYFGSEIQAQVLGGQSKGSVTVPASSTISTGVIEKIISSQTSGLPVNPGYDLASFSITNSSVHRLLTAMTTREDFEHLLGVTVWLEHIQEVLADHRVRAHRIRQITTVLQHLINTAVDTHIVRKTQAYGDLTHLATELHEFAHDLPDIADVNAALASEQYAQLNGIEEMALEQVFLTIESYLQAWYQEVSV